MKKILLITACSIGLLSAGGWDDATAIASGKKLFAANCAVCHGMTGGMDVNKRIAPPIAAVRSHYIESYSDEDSFVQAVSSWAVKQDENNSLMRGAIRKFKIMPPLNVSKEDAEKIAAYIFAGKLEAPEGLEEHVKKEHGKKGKDKGMGHEKGN